MIFKILLCIIGIVLLLLVVAVVRTLLMPHKTTTLELSQDQARIDEYAKKLSKMVSVETISRREDPEIEKFRSFHQVMEELYPTVFAHCEKIDIDGNLMMRWKGKNPALAPIGLMSHMDVVEASGEWKYPAFSGEIAEDRVWGRGSADTKCTVSAFYQAVEELISSGYEPSCDVYLISSCTEEIGGTGGSKMANYMKERGIKLFMLCDEGGSLVENPMGGVEGYFAAVGVFEKGYGDVKFTARSNGGHSSYPGKNTPIPMLAKFIAAVEKKSPFKSQMSPAVIGMMENLAPYCSSFALRLLFGNLWLFKPLLTKLMPSISAQAGAMLRTTIAFTMQKGSDGYNVLPTEASVYANLRFIPHQSTEESLKIITDMAEKYGLETDVITAGKPSRSLDLKSEAYKITEQAIHQVFPGVGMMPYVVTGGTDCRFWDEAAESCVRFGPVLYASEQMKGMHGLNENMFTGCLPGAVDYYKTIIRLQEQR